MRLLFPTDLHCFLTSYYIKPNLPRQQWNKTAKLNNFPEENSFRKDESRKKPPPINSFAIERDMATGWRRRKCLLFPSSLSSHVNSLPLSNVSANKAADDWRSSGRPWRGFHLSMAGCNVGDDSMRWKRERGKRVISQLLFRWYYLFLTCAPPLTHAEDTRMAPFQRPCVISPPTCSACWWWMPDKGMNAGRKEMLTGSRHVTEQQKKEKKTFFFFKVMTCVLLSQLGLTLSLCVSLPPPTPSLQARCLSACSWCPSRSSSAPFGLSLCVASAPGVSVSW